MKVALSLTLLCLSLDAQSLPPAPDIPISMVPERQSTDSPAKPEHRDGVVIAAARNDGCAMQSFYNLQTGAKYSPVACISLYSDPGIAVFMPAIDIVKLAEQNLYVDWRRHYFTVLLLYQYKSPEMRHTLSAHDEVYFLETVVAIDSKAMTYMVNKLLALDENGTLVSETRGELDPSFPILKLDSPANIVERRVTMSIVNHLVDAQRQIRQGIDPRTALGKALPIPADITKTPAVLSRNPIPIRRLEPEMTQEARRQHITGTVSLVFTVGVTGIPDEIKVSKSLGYGLDEAAIEALKRWKFEPALRDGHPVVATANVDFTFNNP